MPFPFAEGLGFRGKGLELKTAAPQSFRLKHVSHRTSAKLAKGPRINGAGFAQDYKVFV